MICDSVGYGEDYTVRKCDSVQYSYVNHVDTVSIETGLDNGGRWNTASIAP